MVDFKGAHYPKSVVVFAVFFYLRCPVAFRDLEEITQKRGGDVDHATLNRWVIKFSPLIAAKAQARKRPTAISWRMDETHIKLKGKCMSHDRAVDRDGQPLKFSGTGQAVKILQFKGLNNIFQQGHRLIKRTTGRRLGFKAFQSATATLEGPQTAHMIRNGQFSAAFQQFARLAA